MPKVHVFIQLKPTVLDAQGQVVRNALHHLGYQNLEGVRMGKFIELDVKENGRPIEEEVREMCESLLANPVMEDYTFEVVEEGASA
jgi:phosphoribosylformylglycinamidine synthase subunit PurS